MADRTVTIHVSLVEPDSMLSTRRHHQHVGFFHLGWHVSFDRAMRLAAADAEVELREIPIPDLPAEAPCLC